MTGPGRPRSRKAPWFPHVVAHGKTMAIIEGRWGNDGYAFWFKLLERLADTDGHAINTENPDDWDFLLTVTRTEDEVARKILDQLARLGAIDEDLWHQDGVIWSDNLVHGGNGHQGLTRLYDKRTTLIPQKPALLSSLRPEKEQACEISGPKTPQSRGEKRREESPPTPHGGTETPNPQPGDIRSKPLRASFDLFWVAWPKGRKKSKGKAERAWKKLKPDNELVAAIMAKLKLAQASVEWAREDGKYIPHPSTWLNAKGWEDEYEPLSGGNGNGGGAKPPYDYTKYPDGAMVGEQGGGAT